MRCERLLWFGAALVGLLCVFDVTPVWSFMYVKEHDLLPQLVFNELASGKKKVFDQGLHHPLLLTFWGADIDTKRERAKEVLALLQDNLAFYRQHEVELAAVFVQPDQLGHAQEVLAGLSVDFPIYVDTLNQSFDTLGVYVMPSVLIVDGAGRIHAGFGYNHDLDEILPGEVRVMLGEMSRGELYDELHPAIVERSTAERRARLDYHYALNLIKRHRPEQALAKLDMALEKMADFPPALIEKGCLLVDEERFQEAREYLNRGLALIPGFEHGQACLDRLDTDLTGQHAEKHAAKQRDPSSWGLFADDGDEEAVEQETGQAGQLR